MRERWRLVTIQNGRRHVSSVVLNEDESQEQVLSEMDMHRMADWNVEIDVFYPIQFTALAADRRVIRTVRAECFDAFNDHPETP